MWLYHLIITKGGDSLLARYIYEKYGFEWDESWEDTDSIVKTIETMKSVEVSMASVMKDIVIYINKLGKTQARAKGELK